MYYLPCRLVRHIDHSTSIEPTKWQYTTWKQVTRDCLRLVDKRGLTQITFLSKLFPKAVEAQFRQLSFGYFDLDFVSLQQIPQIGLTVPDIFFTAFLILHLRAYPEASLLTFQRSVHIFHKGGIAPSIKVTHLSDFTCAIAHFHHFVELRGNPDPDQSSSLIIVSAKALLEINFGPGATQCKKQLTTRGFVRQNWNQRPQVW